MCLPWSINKKLKGYQWVGQDLLNHYTHTRWIKIYNIGTLVIKWMNVDVKVQVKVNPMF